MITLFENFINEIKIPSYIKKDGDVLKIPNVTFKYFSENIIKTPKYYTEVKYNSLMRYFLFLKLLRYNGDSPTILNYIEGIRNKDAKKIEILDKIPNNNIVREMINSNFKFNFKTYEDKDFTELSSLIDNIKLILDDRNLIEYIGIISEVTRNADKSEKIVKGMLNMLYGKYCEVIYADDLDDKRGTDIWKIDKLTGVRQSVQVKNITGKITFNIQDNVIYINNSALDLKPYKVKDNKLHYDYLCFYLEYDKKICLIKSTAIKSIEKYEEDKNGKKIKTIRIELFDWCTNPKFRNYVFKLVDIPKKFLQKDVSKIFYTPEVDFLDKN